MNMMSPVSQSFPGAAFNRVAANAHVMQPGHLRGVISSRGRMEGAVATLAPPVFAATRQSFDVAGFVRALNTALAANTAGYAMEIRQHGSVLATGQSGWGQTPSDGSEVWSEGLRMHVASCSKLITAMAMSHLLQLKGLSPDTKILGYLPTYWAKGQNIGQITFRHLLTHTSGFQPNTSDSSFPLMKSQVAGGVTTANLGTYNYENMNFGLCRILIAVINGDIDASHGFPPATQDSDWDYVTIQAYGAYVARHVFQPAGVVGPSLAHPSPDVLAYGFPVGAGWNSGDLATMSGGAGWHISVSELLDVMGAFRRGGAILSASAAQTTLDAGFGIDVIQATPLGTLYNKNGRWQDGAGRVEQSLAYFLPKDMELVVLTNSPIGTGDLFFRDLVSKLYLDNIGPEIRIGGWVARHGLTGAQYQQAFNDWVGNHGMELTDVSGYGDLGDDYAALWVKTAHSPPWQARHGLTGAQYQQTFDQLTAQDFHPVLVNGYPAADGTRFAAIFHRSQTPAWVARHGLTSAQYQQAFDQYVAMGFVPDWVSGYSENGQDHYAAIWRQLPRPGGWAARHGLNTEQYQQFFDTMVGQGFKPRVVSGYDIGGQDHYAAIFRQTSDARPWQARHGLTAQQYQQTFDQLSAQGYRLEQVNACTVAGQDRFAAIWTK